MAVGSARRLRSLSLLACVIGSSGKHAPKRKMEQPVAAGNESETAALKECQKTLTLRSNTCQAQPELGTYRLKADIPGGHAVYQMVGSGGASAYLYYHEEFGNWRIGYDYKEPKAVLTSSTTKTFRSPLDVHAWFQVSEADNKTWERVHDMTMEDACDEMAAGGEMAGVDEMATIASDRTLGPPSSELEEHPYQDTGAGACRDVDGDGARTTSYQYAAASDADDDLCQAHCDADASCTAYNAYFGRMCVLWTAGDRPEAPVHPWTFVDGAGVADAPRELGPSPSTAAGGGPLADLVDQPTRCMLKLATGGGDLVSARLRLILLAAALLTAAIAIVIWLRQKKGEQGGGAASRVPPSDGAGDEGMHSALPKEPVEAEGDAGDDAQTTQQK